MSYLRMALLFLLATFLQWWWSTYLEFWGLTPQLLLVMTVVAAAKVGTIGAMCYGFAWGLYLDTLTVHLFGANALALTVIGYWVGGARKQVDVTGLASLGAITVGLTWAYFLLLAFLGLVFQSSLFWVGWKGFLLDPVYNLLVVPFAFWAWDQVVGWEPRR